MVFAYIRVSTETQTVENQRFEIKGYAGAKNMHVEEWVEETISGLTAIRNRKLGALLRKFKKGDVLIVSELSRLGRSLLQVMSFLNECMGRGITIFSVKENYELGDNINSKVLAFAFSLSAEIERNLISQRTKEALARKRAEGVILGRKKGSQTKIEKHKCYKNKGKIFLWLRKGSPKYKVAKKLKIHRDTLQRFLIKSGYENVGKGRDGGDGPGE